MGERRYAYELIRVEVDAGVASAVIDNPLVNLMTGALFQELLQLSEEIEADQRVRVLVLKSANPDFFIAHFDVESRGRARMAKMPSTQVSTAVYIESLSGNERRIGAGQKRHRSR